MPVETVAITTITPETASRWLANAPFNRPINHKRLVELERSFRENRIDLIGDAIMLDASDGCLNGQHRLTACVNTGIGFRAVVMRGVPRDVVLRSVDMGTVRTDGQRLAMNGETNSSSRAAISRCLAVLTSTDISYTEHVDYRRIDAALSEFRPQIEEVEKASSNHRIPSQSKAVAAIVMHRGDRDYWHGLLTGENLPAGDPRLALRTWLQSRARVEQASVWSRSIAAADAHLHHEQIAKLSETSNKRYLRLCSVLTLPVNTSLLSAVSR